MEKHEEMRLWSQGIFPTALEVPLFLGSKYKDTPV